MLQPRINLLLQSFCCLLFIEITLPYSIAKSNYDDRTSLQQYFAMEPQDQTAIVGSRVTLPCRVINKIGTLQWTKDDFGLGTHRNLSGFERYSMIGSDEEGDFSLDIYPVMLDDDAKYQCQVGPGPQGQPGVRSRFATITILVPPEEPKITQGDFMVTTEDREIELECISVGGKPAAEITWIDGLGNVLTTGIDYMKEPLSDSRRVTAKSILKLTPKKHHHNTTFTCQAQNTADRTYRSAKLKLEVKYAPKVAVTIISGTTSDGRITEGSDIIYKCHADANPSEVTYRWYINEELVVGDYTTQMTIQNISRKYHDGVVKCEVHNAVGTSDASESIDISYGPAFRTRPKSIEADIGTTVTLSCDVVGNPTPEILWIHEPNDKVVGSHPNLTFRVTSETAGRYYCKASVIGFPEIVEFAAILLKGPPKITSPQRQYGIVGDSTRIECIAFSVPKARHVSWTFKGQEIIANSGDSDYTILEEPVPDGIKSTLVIRDSQSKNFGPYNCTVVNELGNDVLEIDLIRRETGPLLSLVAASASFVIIIMILVIFILFCRKGKKKLKPADVIPDNDKSLNEKEFRDCERVNNSGEMKVDIRRDYTDTYDAPDGAILTRLPDGNTYNNNSSIVGATLSDYRFSGEFTDTGQSKSGQNNNGYLPNITDYSPSNQTSLMLRSSANNSNNANTPDTNYHPNGQVPSVNSTLTRNSNRTVNNDTRQDNGLPNVHGSFNSLQNSSMISQQPLLQNGLNIDLRYRATYGNPFLRTSNASLPPLPPPSTANPAATPAPPPYNATRNVNLSGGSVIGIGPSNTLQSQVSTSSGQFILPTNGNLKKGALATHV